MKKKSYGQSYELMSNSERNMFFWDFQQKKKNQINFLLNILQRIILKLLVGKAKKKRDNNR